MGMPNNKIQIEIHLWINQIQIESFLFQDQILTTIIMVEMDLEFRVKWILDLRKEDPQIKTKCLNLNNFQITKEVLDKIRIIIKEGISWVDLIFQVSNK